MRKSIIFAPTITDVRRALEKEGLWPISSDSDLVPAEPRKPNRRERRAQGARDRKNK